MRKILSLALIGLLSTGIAYAAPKAKSAPQALNGLYQPAGNVIAGNPQGHITLVEFFDYNCGYCRLMYPNLKKLVAQDPNIRLVFREYPILSQRSILPAQAALAAQLQGKYMALHDVMMSARAPLDKGEILKLGAQVGLNTAKLAQDMVSPAIVKQVQANLALGQSMNIQGVPTFMVARTTPPSTQPVQVVIGPSINKLKQLIAEAKAG